MAAPGSSNDPAANNSDAESAYASRDDTITEKVEYATDIEKGESAPSTANAEERVAAETGIEALGPNVVWWDGDNDPHDPQNWSAKMKWTNIAVLSVTTLVTPLASSMFAPGVPDVMRGFHSTNPELATFVVSVYILGFGMGPLVIAPLSEMYGRVPCYHICNFFFTIFTLSCALSSSLGMLIAFRFLAGCMGSAPITIGGGTIADMMPVEQRGRAMAIWAMGPLLGPVIGPIAAGFLVDAAGWRWVFRLLTILGGLCFIVALSLLRETYAPVLLARKAARLREATGNPNLKSKLDSGLSHRDLLLRSIIRPTKMLLFSPMVASLSIYTAVAYGILYILFTTFTYVFEGQYGFSTSVVGLTYIGIGIGMLIGLAVIGTASDLIIKHHTRRSKTLRPEHRLPIPLTVPGGLCLPIGLFIYGWGTDQRVHWIVPMLGTGFVGAGLLANMMCVQTYLIDAYTVHAASAMAANTILRSILGAVLPLCGLRLYDSLGLGWGNSLLGFLALALVPLPVVFRIYGPRVRGWEKGRVSF